jgi:DNA repair photolyase
MKAINKSSTSFQYQINTYKGCEHGCLYCYGMNPVRQKVTPYSEWIQASPKPGIPAFLQQDVKGMRSTTREKIKDIFVCSACDSYQPLEIGARLTRKVIATLRLADLPFTILTKSSYVLDDINSFKGYDKCRVGFTIITLDDNFRKILEPNASPIQDRIDALIKLKNAGISTYCSVEPIMPDKRSDPIAIIDKLKDYVDLFEFGKWNPKRNSKEEVENVIGTKYTDTYYVQVFKDIDKYCNQHGIKYCCAGHSKEFIDKLGIKFIPYPMVLDARP